MKSRSGAENVASVEKTMVLVGHRLDGGARLVLMLTVVAAGCGGAESFSGLLPVAYDGSPVGPEGRASLAVPVSPAGSLDA